MDKFGEILAAFEANLQQVYDLMEFDAVILGHATGALRSLKEKLEAGGFDNQYLSVDGTLKALESVQEHGSLKASYRTIYNQCVVLQVSYFASAARDLFAEGIPAILGATVDPEISKEEIRVSLGELRDLDFELRADVGRLLAARSDLSFQDMKSIGRAFQDFFGFTPPKDSDTDNIIAAQACRHAIVHSGARVDSKVARQLGAAAARTVKPSLTDGDVLDFRPGEIKAIGDSMLKYARGLAGSVRAAIARESN